MIITDDNTAYQAYQAGEIDVMDNLPSEQIPQICLLYTSPSPRDTR